jgi:hypothetical protein
MNNDLKNQFSEPSILHQIIDELNTKLRILTEENQSLKDQLALLKAKRFGKSSEKLDRQIEELELRYWTDFSRQIFANFASLFINSF